MSFPDTQTVCKLASHYGQFFLTSTCAAALSNVPVHKLYEDKTTLQVGSKCPSFSLKTALYRGLTRSHKIGLLIGAQITAENMVLDFKKYKHPDENPKLGFCEKMQSAAIAGVISVPFVAVMSGEFGRLSMITSMKRLSVLQAGAFF